MLLGVAEAEAEVFLMPVQEAQYQWKTVESLVVQCDDRLCPALSAFRAAIRMMALPAP
jgi:hypothetical protein